MTVFRKGLPLFLNSEKLSTQPREYLEACLQSINAHHFRLVLTWEYNYGI